jgi:hypothetical protein
MPKKKTGSPRTTAEAERRTKLERYAYELRFLRLLSVTQTADVINSELEAEGRKPISAPTAWRYANNHRQMLAQIEDESLETKRRTRVAWLDRGAAAAMAIAAENGDDRLAAMREAREYVRLAILVEGSAAPVKTEAKLEVTVVEAKDLELARMLDVAPAADTLVVHEGESA